jgi:hypothetical protein
MTYQIHDIEKELIDQILNEKLALKYWEFQLGVALKYEGVGPGVSFSAPYPELGVLFWSALKYEVYDLLCDSEGKSTKRMAQRLNHWRYSEPHRSNFLGNNQ